MTACRVELIATSYTESTINPLTEPDLQISRIRLFRKTSSPSSKRQVPDSGFVDFHYLPLCAEEVSPSPMVFPPAPSLLRHYPASSLLRAGPTPTTPFGMSYRL